MKKICFVIQRYGLEVNGGAELLCRQMAEHLLPFYDVHVFTTRAKDYITWKNEYKAGIENIHGVRVHRFSCLKKREQKKVGEMNMDFQRYVVGNIKKEKEFLIAQGPYCPELVDMVEKDKNEYSAFIFFTYLYYTTVEALPYVKEKAILVPTAHDEPFIYMSVLKEIFTSCKAIFYMTEVEKELVINLFQNENVKSETGGTGIEIPEDVSSERAKKKYHTGKYLLYAGRVDKGKNVPLLVQYFEEYCHRNKTDLQLYIVGKQFVDIKESQNIKLTGFINDQDKYDLMAGAEAVILPSYHESLSLVILEAMRLERPVIVASQCEVVRQHCLLSNGGLYYKNYLEFEGILNWMKAHPEECRIMGENGRSYVEKKYTWDSITDKMRTLIE